MSDYVPKALAKNKHPQPCIDAPHAWTMPLYGKPTQYSTTDTSLLLDEHATKKLKAISGAFLCISCAIDPTILPALNEISNQQAKPTGIPMKTYRQLMDYLYMHYKAVICFSISDMIVYLVSDALYLVLPEPGVAVPHSTLSPTFLHPSLQPSSQMVLFMY